MVVVDISVLEGESHGSLWRHNGSGGERIVVVEGREVSGGRIVVVEEEL